MNKVGYVQNQPVFGDKKSNFNEITTILGDLKEVDLLVLPELFATGYTMKSKEEAFDLAEIADQGETFDFLTKLSSKLNSVVVAGYIEKQGNKVYNSAMMVYENKLIGNYRKLHLYGKEKEWYNQGDLQLRMFEVKGMKIGMMICYDWFFPEVSRTLMLEGAQIIAHPCNLVMPYCPDAMVTRCLENRVYAVTANRIGEENRAENRNYFIGKSQITSFSGKKISTASENKIQYNITSIDLSLANNKNLNEYNNIETERRKDFFKY